MTVVSNTSPIINLAAIEQLTLLRELYGRISIPCAVYRKIAVNGAGEPDAQEVQRLDWTTSYTVAGQALVGAGERSRSGSICASSASSASGSRRRTGG